METLAQKMQLEIPFGGIHVIQVKEEVAYYCPIILHMWNVYRCVHMCTIQAGLYTLKRGNKLFKWKNWIILFIVHFIVKYKDI